MSKDKDKLTIYMEQLPKFISEASRDFAIKNMVYGHCEQWFGEAAPLIEKLKEQLVEI